MDPRKSTWSPSSASSPPPPPAPWASDSSGSRGSVLPSFLDDTDDAASFKSTPLRHHKHRKTYRRKKSPRLYARLFRNFLALSPALIALFLLAWLVLEVCHLSQDHSVVPRRLGDFYTADDVTTKKESNLDNLDMPTRIVAGVREPCLKLLPVEEIANLQFPPPSSSPIRSLYYKRFTTNIDNLTGSLSRRELFTGNQTMEERDQSFKVSDVMDVHCGFCSDDSIFHINEEDKRFLQQCEIAVITCNFGGGDDIYQPINMTHLSLSKVCYVAFWDKITLEAQAERGRQVDNNGKIGHWRVVVVENLPFTDQRLNGKIPKMLGHRLFINAKYSLWVDSKSQFRRDPMGVLETLLWRMNSTFAISEHGARDCLYKEGEAIVKKHKALPEEVSIQLQQYRNEGFPEKARLHGHKALAEASIIIREHTTLTNLFMCLWFNEVTRFTARDQLSFPYVLRRLDLLHIHMFPVCTRKALVNSLGHVRKAKPLTL